MRCRPPVPPPHLAGLGFPHLSSGEHNVVLHARDHVSSTIVWPEGIQAPQGADPSFLRG